VVFFTLNSRVSTSSALDGLKQGFRNLGYVEGRSITLEERFGEGRREVLAGLAREIVGGQPRAIVTLGTPATDAAKAATSTVPIVFIGVGDPVGSGFAASLAKPGGNLTGFSFVGPEAGREESGVSQGRVPRDQERRSARAGRA
jgi:putative tryptophan/tyrosine transport system substrate-binding protein